MLQRMVCPIGLEVVVVLAHPCIRPHRHTCIEQIQQRQAIQKKESRPPRVRRDDSNKGNHTTPKHAHAHTQEHNLTDIAVAPPPTPPRSSFFFSSSLLILHCPSQPTTIASTLSSPLHTTAGVIQSLTSVSAGPTKTSPSTLQANRRETRSQAAANVQHRSDLLWIPRRRKHCDKQSTVKYECNEQADQSG